LGNNWEKFPNSGEKKAVILHRHSEINRVAVIFF